MSSLLQVKMRCTEVLLCRFFPLSLEAHFWTKLRRFVGAVRRMGLKTFSSHSEEEYKLWA